MTEREALLAAIAVALAAAFAVACPWWVIVAAGVVAAGLVAMRRPMLAIVAVVLVAVLATGTMADRAEVGLGIGAAPRAVSGIGRVVTDPERRPGGLVLEVKVDGARYRSFVGPELAPLLADASVGDEFSLKGRTSDLNGRWEWIASRHLSGQLRISSAGPVAAGSWWWRCANWMHHTVEDGLGSYSSVDRALLLGVVFGDDRGQTEVERYRFRASGLSHLLAVSGQNVGFVLVAAGPVLGRLRLRARWAVTVGVLVWFALVTRLEPSVLRAVAMAMVAATAAWWGRYASGLRIVAVAVTALIMVDPLLVWSTGFRLSVAASVALVVLARPIARQIPGPRLVADMLGVSLAAQIGTAPLLVGIAGSVPLFGPLVNLVAVPVAGWLMVWGVVSGPVAGLLGGPVAVASGLPSRAMLWWLRQMADIGASPGLERLGPLGVWGLTLGLVLWALRGLSTDRIEGSRARRVGWSVARRRQWWAGVVIGLSLVAWDLTVVAHQPRRFDDGGVSIWTDGDATVMRLGSGAYEAAALSALLDVRCGAVDIVIVTGGGKTSAAIVWSLRQVTDVGVVLVADPATVRDSVALVPGTVGAGGVSVEVALDDDRWSVNGPTW